MPENIEQKNTAVNQQSQWAANLKQQKNKSRQQKSANLPTNLQSLLPEEERGGTKNQQSPRINRELGIRQRLELARQLRRQEKKEKKGGGETAVITSKKQTGLLLTARLLKGAWTSLVASFGLTLIYINFHFFMAHIFKSQYFCPLGTEWFPAGPAKTTAKIKNTLVGGAIGIGEILLLWILNVIIGAVIFGILYLIVKIAENSLIFKLVTFLDQYFGGTTDFLKP